MISVGFFYFSHLTCVIFAIPLQKLCVEIGIICSLMPPTVSECNTTVVKRNPRSVAVRCNVGAHSKQNSLHLKNVMC